VPDSLKGRAPPLNVLVVDYSSIYGTDCPAVDTLLLQEDLGRLLAWEAGAFTRPLLTST
jgi:hypothetical protein